MDQKIQAKELYEFLSKTNQNLSKLNAKKQALTSLLCIPSSGLIKVIYNIGHGCSGISGSEEIDGKLLTLTDKGEDEFGLC
eukprot:1862965-Ditylum_brightwellii.AAC.1